MNDKQRTFIEQNIDLIEQGLWEKLLLKDVPYGLIGCLYQAGINVLNDIDRIPDYSFAWNETIHNINIPSTIEYIGKEAFNGCTNLSEVYIPNSVLTIKNHAFNGCSSLKKLKLSDNLSVIERYAFYGCSDLTSIILPDSLISIGGRAFSLCDSLHGPLTIPTSTIEICDSAFNGCSNLSEVNINNEKIRLYYNCFANCGHLDITFVGTKEEWKNIIKGKDAFYGTTYVCTCSDGVVKKSR